MNYLIKKSRACWALERLFNQDTLGRDEYWKGNRPMSGTANGVLVILSFNFGALVLVC